MSTLSRRGHNSISSQKRMSKHLVTEDDLFEYVLRVALLSYLIQAKALGTPNIGASETQQKDHASRISGAISNSIVSFGDLFRDSPGSKSVKFPEKLLKVLEQRLQNIAMAKDPAYSDQLVRRSMAAFYQIMNDAFKKQMKDSRKIEELILRYATTATGVLKKEPSLTGDGWKVELNNQISQFVKLLRECLQSTGHASPELFGRLDMFNAKLAPSSSHSDSGYDSASTSKDRDVIGSPKISFSVSDMQLVRTVSQLFKIPESAVQKEVEKMQKFCTEKAALNDLKTCLKNIAAGASFPGRREDFDSDAAWQHWKVLETATLSQLMLAMAQFNPELARSTPADSTPGASTRPGSVYAPRGYDSSSALGARGSISSRHSLYAGTNPEAAADEINEDDDVPVGLDFTYIPPNPKKYYRKLLELCLVADLEIMLSPETEETDEVSLGILSMPHLDLLNECAIRWRIGHPYRAACFLDLVRQFFERSEIPMECIPEALHNISRVMQDTELQKWPVQDSDFLASVYGGLFNVFLSQLYHSMESLPNLKKSEVEPFLFVLDTVQESGLLDRFDVDLVARLTDMEEQIRTVSAHWYEFKIHELQSAPGVNRALPLLLMSDELEKSAKLLSKRFPEPLLGHLDLVAMVVDIHIPAFIQELQSSQKKLFESSMNGPTPDVPIQDIFTLYRRTNKLMEMHDAFCPQNPIDFDLGSFFEPYVRQWLSNTEGKTGQWVEAAIAADKFQAEDAQGHSSSIVDLFDSLRSPIDFLQALEWADLYQEARFFTSLSKTISKAVEHYCRSVEELFMAEMFPRPTDYLQPQKSSAWIEKAKQLTIQGQKKVEPFNFLPESCVKLNNVEAARKLLDNMYNQMQADKLADVLENHGPAVPDKVERQRFLFTVKVVIAEGLVPLDSSPSSQLDTFVTLSDEAGNRLAKTRTIYETLAPRWDETFDLSVDKPLWLMISIRDRALIGKHDTVGRAYLCLDPKRFGDFLTHDLWMDLDSQGRILLRVSMEGEKDDIQFNFGRAFRSLKRAEGDMVRIFIDKMAPFIQQSLSRPILKSLIKVATTGVDYKSALGNIYKNFGSNNASEIQIPLPNQEKSRTRPDDLTDVQIEAAISPLFDYLEQNLQTLNTNLSDTAKEMVMTRVWKEILTVIEGLLVPPLSDNTSDMKPLSDKEVDIAFKWLKFLRDYFYAGGEGPVPLETLQNQKYRDVVSIRLYYDWHTDALMEECVRMMQQNMRDAPSIKKRAKSVYHSRNLGTIKERKKEKKEEKDVSNGETIMRILRMRPNTSDFIAQQLQIMAAMQAEQEQRAQATQQRKAQRQQGESIPPVPPLPPAKA